MSHFDEHSRISHVYQERAKRVPADYYSLFHSGNLFRQQGRERAMLRLLAQAGLADLSETVALDVGCGSGDDLRQLIHIGARPENLYGVDLIPERLDAARELSPHLNFQWADAQRLPFEDETFDLVMQSTVFTSIIDPAVQRQVASEIIRVLKPGGVLLWYDMRITRPTDKNLVPMPEHKVRQLFKGCQVRLERLSLLPPLARAVAPRAWWLAFALEALPFLRGHLMGIIKKPKA